MTSAEPGGEPVTQWRIVGIKGQARDVLLNVASRESAVLTPIVEAAACAGVRLERVIPPLPDGGLVATQWRIVALRGQTRDLLLSAATDELTVVEAIEESGRRFGIQLERVLPAG